MARHAALLLTLLLAGPASACNLPVFRYALENWNKRQAEDLYALHVFSDGPWSADERRELDALEARLEDPDNLANLLLYRVDVSKPIRDEAIAKLYERHKESRVAGRPLMVLRLPETWGLEKSLYAGPYDQALIESWLLSPLRQKIARRLLLGCSAVFVFLESGDAAADAARFALARDALARLARTVPLPELTAAPKDRPQRDDIPLKVEFDILRLSRTDPAERFLVRMLLDMDEEAFLSGTSQPVLIPVYGRGIAMVNECLVGKGINEENLGRLVRFLLGPCSCEVRRLNPGIEMLLAMNWEGAAPPEPAGAFPAVHVDAPSSQAAAEAPARVWRNVVWVLAGLLVLVLAGSALLRARKRQ